ncbi:MAG: glucans biosynthesis glucosyltransferase MdoH [Rhodospirillaceae bacterium]|nr:glucans biosynthesis glucosyltransferase MdoH [Rhodospirillaceae bacterium]
MTERVDSAPSAAALPRMRGRRLVFLALVSAMILAVVSAMGLILGSDGFTIVEIAMLVLFTLNTPWVVIGFFNALIGFVLLHATRDPIKLVLPVRPPADDAPITERTAIVMPVFNEVPERIFRHLQTVVESLDGTGEADAFEIFLLSDTRDPAIAAEEQARFERWRAEDRAPDRLHYRRREDNTGHKTGNLRDFCERWGDRFTHMIVLDADSVMSGPAIVNLTRTMQANPSLGILQSLPVGLPSTSAFARVFQFGMRHGMRVYATGAAWWQGDEGPYWGHNAILRLGPFRDHCRLPLLPGKPPLGGEILSHDQVEAVLMRRAGYEVRVLPVAQGSFEENPPTLPDFLKRDLRWCNGNMQYLKLLRLPGIRPLGRLQLVLAILMYLGAPFWLGFLALGFTQAAMGTAVATETAASALIGTAPSELAIGLFMVMIAMSMSPVLFGVADVLCDRRRRQAYGGAGALIGGAAAQLLFGVLLGPILSIAHTIFIVGLLFGRCAGWDAQTRDGHRISLGQALRGLWPQTATGVAVTAGLAATAPSVLPWAAPICLGLVLSVPFACITSSPALGRRLQRLRVCATPEERQPPPVVRRLGLRALTGYPGTPERPAVGEPVAMRVRSR